MDDREIVTAMAAGDPAGLAAAYDEHAESTVRPTPTPTPTDQG